MTKQQTLELISYKLSKLKASDVKEIAEVIFDTFNFHQRVKSIPAANQITMD